MTRGCVVMFDDKGMGGEVSGKGDGSLGGDCHPSQPWHLLGTTNHMYP